MADTGKQPTSPDPGNNAAASAAAFLDEARGKLKAGDTPGALICLKTVAGLAGCPPELQVEAAKMLAQAGDNDSAIAAYIEAGTTYLNVNKDYQKARQTFQAGHALDVHNLDVIYMLGQADVNDGRLQDGLAKFIDVLRKSNLKHVPALFAAGSIYQSNGQFDQAMLAFKKVLDRDKNHVQATVRIGQLYQSKELMTDAIGYYTQAAQLARECQHWSTARQIASMVLAIDPQNQKARILLDELEEQGHSDDVASADEPAIAPGSPTKPAAPIPAHRPVPTGPRPEIAKPAPPPQRPAAQTPAPKPQPVSAQPVPAQAALEASKPAPTPVVAQVAAKISPPRPEPATAAAPQAPAAATPATARPQAAAPEAPSKADVDRERQMLAAIEAQRQAAQQDLQLLLQTREELQKALSEQRAILEAATMRKNDLDSQLSAAQAVLEEAKNAGAAAQAQGGEGKQQLDALRAERTELETALASLRSEAETLTARKNADETSLRELSALRDQTATEVAALTAKMQDAKRLTDELEVIRATAGAADEQAAKAQTASAEIIALEARRSALQNDLSGAQAELAKLREDMAQTQAQADQAHAARDAAQAEAEALAARVAELSAGAKELEARPGAAASIPVPAVAVQANVGPQGAHARAAAHLAAGEFDRAIDAYKQALEANPQDAAAAYQAGSLLAEHGSDLEGAERLLTQAAELRPDHAATRYQLAIVKARQGKVVEGAELLSALARADANNGDFVDQFVERMEKDASSGDIGTKFRLGLAYRELGRIEEALVTLQAIQHEPGMVVPCLIAIGSCLRRQGLDGAAAKRFAKAIETPGYPENLYLEALYNLGDLYEAKGTQESLALALSSFEELYARDLTYRDIGERVRVVKANLSSAERQKVKRLPTRMADSQGNQ